ncbi:MAG: hypothetical protein HY815_07320 [Candidatus Riflebacteria bacterium]|nr:hypothetical protein [Candidatus Riflebacteria bacterium]
MRRQDELLGLYRVGEGPARRYIVGLVPSLPIHFDSDEVEALLGEARSDPDAAVAGQAAWAWQRIGPDLTLYAHGLDDERLGVWSTLALALRGGRPASRSRPGVGSTATMEASKPRGPLLPTGPPGPPRSGPEVGDEWAELDLEARPSPGQRAALASLLEPCRESLLALASRRGPAADLATEILGLVPIQGGEAVLEEAVRGGHQAFTALLALARHDRVRARQLLARGRPLPLWQATLVASVVGGPEAYQLAREAVKRGNELSRWGAALALPALVDQDWPRLAASLLEYERGWVQVLVMDALGRIAEKADSASVPPDGALVRLLERGVKRAEHDMIRVAAVRAMGSIRSEGTLRTALKCLDRGSPKLQAAAIEALARLELDDADYRDQLRARSSGRHLKLRGTAILGLAALDREAALRGAIELVRSGEPAARVEGAHCLGYLQCRTSLDLLAVVAQCDPFLPSALAAQKSLAHYPEAEAAPVLMKLLDHPTSQVASGALRVLSHFPGEAQRDVVSHLERLVERLSPDDRPLVLRHAGRLGPAVEGIVPFLAREGRPGADRVAALEGLARAGEIPVEFCLQATRSDDPAIAARGAAAAVVGGDSRGVAHLARILASEAGAVEALLSLRELAVLAGEAGRGGRHRRLQRLVLASAPGLRAPAGPVPVAAAPIDERPAVGPEGEGVPAPAPSPYPSKRIARPGVPVPVRAKDTPEQLKKTFGIDREALVAELAKKLGSLKAGGVTLPELGWLLELSYIQTQGLALLSGARALAHPALLAAVAALGLVLIVVSSTGGSGGHARIVEQAGLDSTLAVSGLVGRPCRVVGSKELPLAIGEPVQGGETIRTGSGQKALLESRSGLAVYLFPETAVKLVVVPRPGLAPRELSLELASGVVVADSRGAGRDLVVRVRGASGELTGQELAARIAIEAGTFSVHLGTGRGTLASRAGGGEVTLEPARHSVVPPAGHPTQPAPFQVPDVAWR